MFNDLQKRLTSVRDNPKAPALISVLLIPIVGWAVLRLWRRVQLLDERFPNASSLRGLVPNTGSLAAAPTLDQREMSAEQMAAHKTRARSSDTRAHVVSSQPASAPFASEDSPVEIAGPHGIHQPAGQRHPLKMPPQPTSAQVASAPRQRNANRSAGASSKSVPSANDFRIIEGIGPKISARLHRAGIRTFQDLANAPLSQLSEILEQAGIRQLADPSTWSEQASLAAKGSWDELTELQRTLYHGKRQA